LNVARIEPAPARVPEAEERLEEDS
jgi:hypothetical protein